MNNENAIYDYILDPENPIKNFNLAIKYKELGQTAAAISFFLRCADRSKSDLDLAYECLIHIGQCFDIQGNRFEHVRCMYRHAISILPQRPEAYYMLANFENWHKQYQVAYTFSSIALKLCDFNQKEFILKSRYFGVSGLIYEKVLSSYYQGKSWEVRNLYKLLVDRYWQELDDYHKDKVRDNFSRLGATPLSQSEIRYTRENHNSLRFKFKGSESIERNYSQVFQDMFVLSVLDGKEKGTFVEIGSAEPMNRNNTFLLEFYYGWKGLAVEIKEDIANAYKELRPSNKVLNQDALTIDYENVFSETFNTNEIDYLQLDIEPSRNTYECMLKIPFDKYKFAVITYEHDYYLDIGGESYRQKSRDFLESKGYVMVVNDISPEGKSSFEDWWVHPDLVDDKIIQHMKDVDSKIKDVKQYMFPFM